MCGQLTPLTHDFHRLLKNVKKLSNNQAKVLKFEDDLTEFDLEIKPNDGYYKRGKFDFKVGTNNYPQSAPNVCCLTRIYHPNISEDYAGDVCLSLFDDWTDKNDLEDCVQGLLFLLYNPNLQDPLNPNFSPEDEDQHNSFEEDVKKSLEGEIVEGVEYDRNIVEEELVNEEATEINNDGTEEPLQTGVEEPLQTGVEEPLQTGVEEPLQTGEEEPLQTGVGEPLQTGVEEPLQTGEEEPLQTGVGEPLQTRADEPLQTGVAEPLQTGVEEPLNTEAVTKDDKTPSQDNTIVKDNELSENDILNAKNNTGSNSTFHDKTGLQNTRNQPEGQETKIADNT